MSAQLKDAPFSTDQLVRAGFDRQETIALMKEDLNFFAGLVISSVFVHLFPGIHQQIWKLLQQAIVSPDKFYKLALGLPRGQ